MTDLSEITADIADLKSLATEHEEAIIALQADGKSILAVVQDLARQVLQLQALAEPEEEVMRPALQLVPTIATDDMLEAGFEAIMRQLDLERDFDFETKPVWEAFLAAAGRGSLVPVAWRVRAPTGGHIVFYSREAAEAQAGSGDAVQPLYVLS